ncbi:hypothetical protein [Intestinimonas butyriciproducens]|uniref:hypothetical protein n=1 Tax=Intestinimonas butyriciproducens TaxID=1297617 RepID=UPI00189960A3|nr:hypothetical protein [Intestinimonas butyriciproducens]MDB7829100.1 hypothetical protein [Intestinimonas butyriciproducens]
MAKIAFKKGLLANLPAAKVEGTFYITTDERAMYLDIDGTTRVRIGDFQEFATLTALQANTNPSTTALYYVTELNCLAKWDGTKYVQINLDTGATSAEATGTGNALDGVTYDPITRKLTFTKTATFATASDVDSQIAAKVGELKIGDETFATVKAYVDKKTDGIATDAALETLTNRVTIAEGKLDTLNGDKTTSGSVAKAVADLQGDTESTVADVDARVCTIEDNYVDQYAIDTSISDAIGTNPDKKTVAELIADAKNAATYDDAALSGKVDTLIGTDTGKSARTIANEELAKQLIPENAAESLDTLGEIAAWIQAHPDDASAMNAAIAALQVKLALGTHEVDGEQVEYATVKAYVEAAIAALNIGDYAAAGDLTALAARVTTAEGKLGTLTSADTVEGSVAKALKDAKAYTDEKDTAMDTRMGAVEGKAHEHSNKSELDKIADGDKAKWDAAEQNAKTYADDLLTWGTF